LAKHNKRIRRTPEEARTLILDAAEKTMGREGPAALRLQDVAREAGVSHPTILHHFGSREGLVRALNLRGLERLRSALLERIGGQHSSEDGIARSFRAFRDGMAQRILWLMQMKDLPPGDGVPLVEEIAQSLHALRVSFAPPGASVDFEDSRAISHLVAVAGFGDAVMGARLRQRSGQDETQARANFERWLAALIDLHIRSYHG
jgi:AcrR family transcriptional regulator